MFGVTYVLVFLTTFLLTSALLELRRRGKKKPDCRRMPPSLPCLPLVGSLPFMKVFGNLPKFFMVKAEELGPMFSCRIGTRFCLVLNNKKLIEEAFLKNGSTFSGRGEISASTCVVNKNRKGIGSRTFDSDFKKYRKLSLFILKDIGFGTKHLIESRILQELESMVAFVRFINGAAFDPKTIILQGTSNIIMNISLGIRADYESGLSEISADAAKIAECADTAIDVVPVLRFLPHFKQKFDGLCEALKSMVRIIDAQIRHMKANGEAESFVTRYLERVGPEYDHEQLVYTVRDFVLAGTSSTAETIRWSVLFLANNPVVQRRIQDEIDSEIPRSRFPSLDDKIKLPYAEATILEIMRLRTLAPLAIPHLSLTDSEFNGYFIPSGTVVMPNIYAVHMDPEVWGDPEVFRPERFLSDTFEVIGRDRIIPFSLGSRSCLGKALARQEVFLFIAAILQSFTIVSPDNQQRIDDREHFGVAVEAKPFKIRMISRNE